MIKNLVQYEGKIFFEPPNRTKKHDLQSEWKRVAMVVFGGDLCEYYAWFLKRRHDITLNKVLRGAHITFINDNYLRDSILPDDTKEGVWKAVKAKYDGSKINITLSLDYHTNGNHYWLIVNHDYREELHKIRSELGLGKPYFGLHMSIGLLNDQNRIQSDYIIKLANSGFIKLREEYEKTRN